MMRGIGPNSEMDQLAKAAARGEGLAFDRLFVAAHERLRLFVRARLSPYLRADGTTMDVVQDVYVASSEAFAGFEWRGERAFVGWLCAIADHCMRRSRERQNAAKRNPGGRRLVATVLADVTASGHGVVTHAARLEQREKVAAALDGLETADREAVLLRFYAGLSYEQAAHRVGSSASAQRRRVARAVRALTVRLRDQGDAL